MWSGFGGSRGSKHGTDQKFQGDRGFTGETRAGVAQALLDEALTLLLNGDPETAKLILRDLVNTTIGFEGLAGDLHKPSKSLHRMLSRAGNPTMENLSAILVAIKKALRVEIHAVASFPDRRTGTFLRTPVESGQAIPKP